VPANKPYSLSRLFCLIAISRSRTLCSFEPVKYIRAEPYAESGTMRRSHWIVMRSVLSRTDDLVSPLARICVTSGMVVKKSRTASGADLVFLHATRMSMSPIVSFPRRSEPA